MMVSLLLASCGTTSTSNDSLEISSEVEFGEEDYLNIVSSNNELGFQLLAEAKRDEQGNIFISPTSLFMALAMVFNGADGPTKEEIAKVINANGLNPEDINKANASLMNILSENTEQIQLNIANSIWLNDSYHFQEEFSSTSEDYFNAEIKEINIEDAQSPKMINDWVKQATNGKIGEIVEEELNPEFVTMLINAIYFYGGWTYPFEASKTKKYDFTLEDGSTKDVPLMELHEHLFYMENNLFQAVSLPYGQDESMSMEVFLPREDVSLKEFEEMLTFENWQEWRGNFAETEGTILLPKFKLEYEVELKETLESLGMPSAFNENANFSKMIQEAQEIAISSVKQKTFIDVNEEGTEAAAVTSVEMETAAMQPMYDPFHMEVNRPFYLFIVDEKTDVILFMGSIKNPQE